MISVQEIRKIECKKHEQKKELYKAILLRLMKKIKSTVESGKTQTFLEIPMFLPGWPLFDRDHATKYLTRQLTNLGYSVSNYSSYVLYVSWIKPAPEKPQTEPLPPFINVHKLADDIRRKNVTKH